MRVKRAKMQVIMLAQATLPYILSGTANGRTARVRLKAENDRLRQNVAICSEELLINDARASRMVSNRRPHHMHHAADAFPVTEAIIVSWMKRVDAEGPDAVVQIREPVNRLSDFERYAAQRPKVSPTGGGLFALSLPFALSQCCPFCW